MKLDVLSNPDVWEPALEDAITLGLKVGEAADASEPEPADAFGWRYHPGPLPLWTFDPLAKLANVMAWVPEEWGYETAEEAAWAEEWAEQEARCEQYEREQRAIALVWARYWLSGVTKVGIARGIWQHSNDTLGVVTKNPPTYRVNQAILRYVNSAYSTWAGI